MAFVGRRLRSLLTRFSKERPPPPGTSMSLMMSEICSKSAARASWIVAALLTV
jgi:hypothetical protein